jgi:ferredoxin-NADP reductase
VTGIVVALKHLAPDVLQLTIRAAESALSPFAAGAHIRLRRSSLHPWRRYSLISDPDELHSYMIAVLRVPSGVSADLHNHVRVGDALEISTPLNDFALHVAAHTILIAGGIGVTPILAFARALSARRASFEVHVAARSNHRLLFANELRSMAGTRVSFYVGGPQESALTLSSIVPAFRVGTQLYVCGPRGMIEETRQLAAQRGWPAGAVHVESFGVVRDSDATVDIELALSAGDVTVPADRSILDVAEEHGAWSAAECRRGECGKCAVEYSGADVSHRDVCLDEESRRTLMCPCVSRPMGAGLVLQL